jgi:hypothetical protein
MTIQANFENQTDRSNAAASDAHILTEAELDAVLGGGLMLTLLTNIAQMRHESLKGIANNLRG